MAYAQTQQGVAKTKGRLNSDGTVTPGTLLKGVTIKVKGRTAVLSDDKGAFTFPVPGQQYSLETVRKNGYALVDPETLSRQYAYSKDNPLVLVLETPGRQADDELANERKIRRNLQRQLMQREDEIEQLREENRITQEEYRTRLQELYAQQETSEKLIAKMVEYYSRIDYDQLDDYNRQISTYILNGELARADSLLSTKGDINTRIAALRRHQSVNADERAALPSARRAWSRARLMPARNWKTWRRTVCTSMISTGCRCGWIRQAITWRCVPDWTRRMWSGSWMLMRTWLNTCRSMTGHSC